MSHALRSASEATSVFKNVRVNTWRTRPVRPFGLMRRGAFASVRKDAATLRQAHLSVPRSEAVPLPEGRYYVDDVLGLQARLIALQSNIVPTTARAPHSASTGIVNFRSRSARSCSRSIVPAAR